MDYKRKEPLDYKDIADNLENPAWWDLENRTNLLDDAATAINDLLISNMGLRIEAKAFKSRAEKAEAENGELHGTVFKLMKSDIKRAESLKSAESQAEKAEKERDEAIDLIGWIYYEACVSVEHDMRQHLDWLKDKIEEWKKNKEE